MSRKVFIVLFFLLVSVFNIAFGQEIYVELMSEEIMRWRNNSYNIYHFYDSLPRDLDRPLLIMREIVNYLQTNNYISAGNTSNPQKINLNQFDWDLDLSDWRGGHPIFEWWNPTTNWKAIKYKSYLYIIRIRVEGTDDFGGDIYRINIRG
jgi:hypothetical protein